MFNKQAILTGDNGRATSDALVIGQNAWKILKAFAFDPRDLRGIGIQIQKLEMVDKTDSHCGQTKLGFEKRPKEAKEMPKKKERKTEPLLSSGEIEKSGVKLTVQPPSSQSDAHSKATKSSQGSDDLDVQEFIPDPNQRTQLPKAGEASNLFLPSFSQVDRSAFEALPTQMRTEIHQEYSRRSASPALSAFSETRPPSLSPPKRLKTDKGIPLSRIAQALAPRTKDGSARSGAILGKGETGMDGLKRGNLFERCVGQTKERGSRVVVSRAELEKLGLDTRVFYELPKEVQLEQLASARFEKSFGKKGKKTRRQ